MRVEHDGSLRRGRLEGRRAGAPGVVPQLRRAPEVELQDGRELHDYSRGVVEGEERADWWERAVEMWPDYAEYQEKTDREIPVFVLERA